MRKTFLGSFLVVPLILLGYTLSVLGGVKGETAALPAFIPDWAYVQPLNVQSVLATRSEAIGVIGQGTTIEGKKSSLFYLLYVLFIIYFVFFLYSIKKYMTVEGFSSEKLSSDLALGHLGEDRYGSAVLVQSMVSLLSSPFTKTPLSMAIDASWGQGKSSLINMTQNELSQVGIPSLVFNAWHHQHDKHLLSSLMKSMLTKFMPSTVSWENFIFRVTLFYHKVLSTPNGMMWLLFYVALIYIASSIEINGYGEYVEPSSFLLLLAFIFKTLKPYGGMTKSLTKKYKHVFSLKSFNEMVGLEPEFIDEINHLVRPLGRVVIFIDDLDRCADDNIFDMMQTINYLTAIPNIFIVMSVDRNKIVDALERYYGGNRKVAEEYLNKIFNVTLKIPEVESDFYKTYRIDANEKRCKMIKENPLMKSLSKIWMRWFGMITLVMLLTTTNVTMDSLDKISSSISNLINTKTLLPTKKKKPAPKPLTPFKVDKRLREKIIAMPETQKTMDVVYGLRRSIIIPERLKTEIEFYLYIKEHFYEIIEIILSENINAQLALMGVILLFVLFYFVKRYYAYHSDDVAEIWSLVHRKKGLNPREKNILFNKINLFMVLGTKKYVTNVTIGTMFQMIRKQMFSFLYWFLFIFVIKTEEKHFLQKIKMRIRLARKYAFFSWKKKHTNKKEDLKIIEGVLFKNSVDKDSRFDVISFYS